MSDSKALAQLTNTQKARRVTALCRSKSYSVLCYSKSLKHMTSNAQNDHSDPWQHNTASCRQRSPWSLTPEAARCQAFGSDHKSVSHPTPPLPPHQLGLRRLLHTKGLHFHNGLQGTGSAHAALPCPHLAHYSTANHQYLPEPSLAQG